MLEVLPATALGKEDEVKGSKYPSCAGVMMPQLLISGACLRSAAAFGVRLVEALRYWCTQRLRASAPENNENSV